MSSDNKCQTRKVKHYILVNYVFQELVEALKALSTFFNDNTLRARRNLRGDVERRNLVTSEQFEMQFREVKEVRISHDLHVYICTPTCQSTNYSCRIVVEAVVEAAIIVEILFHSLDPNHGSTYQ